MHFSTRTQTTVQNLALAACWALLAYCRIAGLDTRVMTAGPSQAPKPTTRLEVCRAADY